MQTENQIVKPIIFEYKNYRIYLQDLYDFYKKTTSFFSYRYFSKRAGFKSPNYLKLVIENKRNISKQSVERFCHALKLNQKECAFFEKLVAFNQAENNSERAQKAIEMTQSKIYQRLNPLKKEQLEYYSRWYQIGIRELTLCANFVEDPSWVAEQFSPRIEKDQAQKALDSLQAMGLLGRDDNGKLMPTNKNIATHDEVSSNLVTIYHKQMIDKGKESIDIIPSQEREISSVCVPLSEESFQKIKNKIQDFRKEMMAIANEEQHPDQVYQFNFQLFPLTKGNS